MAAMARYVQSPLIVPWKCTFEHFGTIETVRYSFLTDDDRFYIYTIMLTTIAPRIPYYISIFREIVHWTRAGIYKNDYIHIFSNWNRLFLELFCRSFIIMYIKKVIVCLKRVPNCFYGTKMFRSTFPQKNIWRLNIIIIQKNVYYTAWDECYTLSLFQCGGGQKVTLPRVAGVSNLQFCCCLRLATNVFPPNSKREGGGIAIEWWCCLVSLSKRRGHSGLKYEKGVIQHRKFKKGQTKKLVKSNKSISRKNVFEHFP